MNEVLKWMRIVDKRMPREIEIRNTAENGQGRCQNGYDIDEAIGYDELLDSKCFLTGFEMLFDIQNSF